MQQTWKHGYGMAPQVPAVRFAKLNGFMTLTELAPPRSTKDMEKNATNIKLPPFLLGASKSFRVILRFCLPSPMKQLQVDKLPKVIRLKIDGEFYLLENKYADQCCDITDKLVSNNKGMHSIQRIYPGGRWHQTQYYYGIYLALKRQPENIYKSVIKHEASSEMTINIVKKIIDNVHLLGEIVTEPEVKVSLLCPLTKKRMAMPIRASTCTHLQCFDAKSFIHANEITQRWRCPFCKDYVFVDDLHVDKHLLQILKYVSADCTAVNLRIDGTWSEVSNIPAKSKCTKKNVQTECITLDDSIIIEESLQVGKLGDTEIECITLDDSIIDYK